MSQPLSDPTHNYRAKTPKIALPFFLLVQLTVMALCSSSSRASEVPFSDLKIISNTAGFTGVHPADLDGDGDLDLIAVDKSSIYWFENASANGASWKENTIQRNLLSVQSVHSSDIDHDGDLDILASDYKAMQIFWWENTDGKGSFGAQRIILQGYKSRRVLYPVDLDNDGDQDIITAGQESLSWLEHSGNPQESHTIAETSWIEHSILNLSDHHNVPTIYAPADIDADGTLDIVISGYYNTLAFRNLSGDGTSWEQKIWPGELTTREYISDVDGDGDLDVYCTGLYGSPIWYEDQGVRSGSWIQHTTGIRTGLLSRTTGPMDLDMDGDIGVLYGANYYEYTGAAAKSWKAIPITIKYEDQRSSNSYEVYNIITYVDIDGDADLDFVGTSDNSLAWWENLIEPIQITSPKSGDRWAQGLSRDITWTTNTLARSVSDVKIELLQDDAVVRTIVESTPNNRLFSWEIPYSLPKGSYKIRISDLGDPSISGTSLDTFSILIGPPVLDTVTDSGNGATSLTWTNPSEEPAQFLALAWDIYDEAWVERGWNDSLWYNYSSNSRTGVMDLEHSGGYHIWIAGHHGDATVAICDNPWTGIVSSGVPHKPLGLRASAGQEENTVLLEWKSDLYGTWLYWIIAYNLETKQWAPTRGPRGEKIWHYLAHGSEDFLKGSTELTMLSDGPHRFFITGVAFDGETWGEFAGARVKP